MPGLHNSMTRRDNQRNRLLIRAWTNRQVAAILAAEHHGHSCVVPGWPTLAAPFLGGHNGNQAPHYMWNALCFPGQWGLPLAVPLAGGQD